MTKVSAIRSTSDDVFVLTISSESALTDSVIKGILLEIHNSIGVSSEAQSNIDSADNRLCDGSSITNANETCD